MKKLLAMFVIALCLAPPGGPAPAYAEARKLVVVVARGSSLTSISRGDLQRCFSGEPVTVGSRKLVPFNASPNSPERVGFDRAVLGMTPEQVGRYWVDRKVRGQGSAPRSLPSAAHAVKVAAKFPGAIAYLPADQLTEDIQPVAIDGVAHTDARYPIIAQ
jgi:hypothetical protein